jgi:hypothetical protein
MTLKPGQSHSIPVAQLRYGLRGGSEYAYWTEPGDYTLTASFNTAISPAPANVKPQADGFGQVTLTSEPIKIKVEGK